MRGPKLTYANVMATIAVFVALGGGAYAAITVPRDSVNTNSIRNGQVKAADIGFGAVGAEDVADGSLGAAEIADGTLGGAEIVEALLGQVPDAAMLGGKPASAYLQDADFEGFLRDTDSILGGDLAGTYAAPSLKAGSVGPGDLATLPAVSISDPIYNVAGGNACQGAPDPDGFPSTGPPYPEIQFSDVDFDTAGLARQPNPANECFDSLIAPIAGTYVIAASIFWQPEAAPTALADVSNRKIELRAENPGGGCCGLHVATEGPQNIADGGTHDTVQTTGGIARLQAGARIFLKGFQTTGTDQEFRRGSLQAVWVGP